MVGQRAVQMIDLLNVLTVDQRAVLWADLMAVQKVETQVLKMAVQMVGL